MRDLIPGTFIGRTTLTLDSDKLSEHESIIESIKYGASTKAELYSKKNTSVPDHNQINKGGEEKNAIQFPITIFFGPTAKGMPDIVAFLGMDLTKAFSTNLKRESMGKVHLDQPIQLESYLQDYYKKQFQDGRFGHFATVESKYYQNDSLIGTELASFVEIVNT